jgi:hypothetical protein
VTVLPSHPTTSPDLLVLHALRCMGSAGLGRVATATGLAEPDAESELIDLAVAGLAGFEPGEFGGWRLTEAGKAADAARIADELDAAGARAAVTAAYDRFLVLNPELLDLCAAWQTRDGAAHRGRVVELLVDLAGRADAVCADLAAALPRFARHRARLAAALARVRAGDTDHITTDVESYHSVWFQLHEDLLVTLGVPRW